MPRDRLPRISLLRLSSLSKSAKRIKYNWVAHIDELFFKPIGESDLLKELDKVWTSEEIKRVSEKYASLKLEEDFKDALPDFICHILKNFIFLSKKHEKNL